MKDEEGVSLEKLGQGAAVERFGLALQEVLDNIQDVNTDPKKARTVTLKATLKPSEDRGLGTIIVDVTTKLAPTKPFDVHVFLGRDKEGKGYATEYVAQQQELFNAKDGDKKTEIYQLKKEAKA